MKVKEQQPYKWFDITHKGFKVDVGIDGFGRCKVNFTNISSHNRIYLGEIGFTRLDEIADVLKEISKLAEKEIT